MKLYWISIADDADDDDDDDYAGGGGEIVESWAEAGALSLSLSYYRVPVAQH